MERTTSLKLQRKLSLRRGSTILNKDSSCNSPQSFKKPSLLRGNFNGAGFSSNMGSTTNVVQTPCRINDDYKRESACLVDLDLHEVIEHQRTQPTICTANIMTQNLEQTDTSASNLGHGGINSSIHTKFASLPPNIADSQEQPVPESSSSKQVNAKKNCEVFSPSRNMNKLISQASRQRASRSP